MNSWIPSILFLRTYLHILLHFYSNLFLHLLHILLHFLSVFIYLLHSFYFTMILDKFSMNFPFLLILPLLFINVEADGDRLDTPDNIKNFHLIVGFSLTLIILGWIGCIYVFYRIYKQWLLSKKRLAMIYRLPFYSACSGKT